VANEKLSTGPKGLALIQEFEGLKLTAYQDSVGVWTIGWGTTKIDGKPVTKGMVITEVQAIEYLKAYLANSAEHDVRNAIKIPLTQNQFDALVSFAYNLGGSNLLKSTLAHYINIGKPIFEDLFTRWNKAGGQELAGLTRRRKAEFALFKTP
jgi:lysozyme